MTPLAECIAQLRAHIDLLSRPSGTEQTESLHEEERALEELLRRLEVEELILRRERDTAAASLAHAETVLAEQRRLIESGPHGYIVTTALGIIQHVNAAAIELLNLQGTFLVGKPLASFVADGDLRTFRWRLNNAKHQQGNEWPLRLKPRQGSPFVAGLTLSRIGVPGPSGHELQWLLRDISARERAEELAAANEFARERLRAEETARAESEAAQQRLELVARVSRLLATSVEPVLVLTDLTGLVLPQVADLFLADFRVETRLERVTAAHVDPARTERLRNLTPAFDELPDHHPLAQVMRSDKPLLVEEASAAWLESWAGQAEALAQWQEMGIRSAVIVPLRSHRRSYGALTFACGPTGRRYDSADLNLLSDIALRIALAFDSMHLVRELEAEHERKDKFLAMLAHELRNPIATVSSALQAMNGAESPERLRLTGILTRQVGHLVRLVNDLLDVSRIRLGIAALQPQRIDLRPLARRSVEAVQVQRERANVTVEVTERPVLVLGDPDRLEQVIGNLLDNAVKYTSPGGAITLRVDIEDGEAVVRVRDTGIGIASEFLPQVFDVFSRVGSHATQSRPGLGLGLAVVRELVMQHGGTVAVSSPGPGRGAEFVIRLPLLDENEGAVAPVSAKPTRGDPVLSVLLVEDNDDAREALRILLELKGQRVLTARDGREAVEEVQAQSPDVALIDIGLPDVDGFEVARILRAQPEYRAVRLIALTGYAGERDRALGAGFDDFLVKPVNPDALFTTLERVCAGPHLRGTVDDRPDSPQTRNN
jgi:PAS domain S-box-containing protein